MPPYVKKKCRMCGGRIGISTPLTGKFRKLTMGERGFIKKSLCPKCFMVMFGILYGRSQVVEIDFHEIKTFIEKQNPEEYSYSRRI